jgi:hypothetical protein
MQSSVPRGGTGSVSWSLKCSRRDAGGCRSRKCHPPQDGQAPPVRSVSRHQGSTAGTVGYPPEPCPLPPRSARRWPFTRFLQCVHRAFAMCSVEFSPAGHWRRLCFRVEAHGTMNEPRLSRLRALNSIHVAPDDSPTLVVDRPCCIRPSGRPGPAEERR